jgi:hypothetical protein
MFPQDRLPARARRMLTSGIFLLVFGSVFSITLTLAYASLGSTPQEQFITLSTVGSDMTTRTIYPSSNSFVSEGDTLDWNVQLYNRMGQTEFLSLRVKVLNATQFGPDEMRHIPSPTNHVYEERIVLGNNSTMTLPLKITMADVERASGDSAIMSLVINGQTIDRLDISNDNSNSFRFIIELWRYDVKFENFVYSWPSGTESESTWNQIRIQVR